MLNWRRSYRRAVDQARDEIRNYRERGFNVAYEIDGLTVVAPDLDDEEVEIAARDQAQREVERAINKFNETQLLQRHRKGLAQ